MTSIQIIQLPSTAAIPSVHGHKGTVVKDSATTQLTVPHHDEGLSPQLRAILKPLPGFELNGRNANVIEFAQSTFAVSAATDGLKRKIEDDFLAFNAIFSRGGIKGSTGAFYGWTEEHAQPNLDGGKGMSFLVLRDWDSMQAFEESMQRDAFRESIPILHAWGAPFKMVSASSLTHGPSSSLTFAVACPAHAVTCSVTLLAVANTMYIENYTKTRAAHLMQ